MSDSPLGQVPELDSAALELLAQRQAARANRDFATADSLRLHIEQLGYMVVDTAEGPKLQPKQAYESRTIAGGLPAYAVGANVAVTVVVDGWLEDVRTFVDALLHNESDGTHALLVDVSDDDELAVQLEQVLKSQPRVSVVHLAGAPGWADIHAAAAAACQAEFYAAADMSTVLDGPAVTQCIDALLADSKVVAAGWRGANIDLADGWRSVVDAGTGACDVLLSYLMVMRTATARAVPPHPRASFYRNADIEWSLRLRERASAETGSAPSMIALGDGAPAHQTRHHGYHDSDPEVRDRESRRTYDRILKTFRGRTELLAH